MGESTSSVLKYALWKPTKSPLEEDMESKASNYVTGNFKYNDQHINNQAHKETRHTKSDDQQGKNKKTKTRENGNTFTKL